MSRNKIVFSALIFFLSASGFAQDANQSLLISKLEKVSQTLADKDEAKVAVTLRLADLYSERARQDSMVELDKGCANVCKAGEVDRVKALRLYNEVLPRVPVVNRGKVIVQIGHLYQLSGQQDKAIQFYDKVLSDSGSQDAAADLKTEAHLSLAEIYFKKSNYKLASAHYQEILKPSVRSNSKGLAAYRNAWCMFNSGDYRAATQQIEAILNNPDLLSKSTANGEKSQINVQFHEEVSKDYATFLTRGSVGAAELQKLYKLSPESSRVQNLQYLAFELDRVGKKSESLLAWKEAYASITKPDDKITALLAMAQIQLDQQDKKSALSSFDLAMGLLKDIKQCEQSKGCDELRRRARFFVVSWNQIEKKQPSAELLTAYQTYFNIFSADVEMKSFAVQAAKDGKNYEMAWKLQQGLLADMPVPQTPKDKDLLEKNLILQLDLAETMGDQDKKNIAYDNYLKLSALQTKVYEVRYQKARQQYDKNEYAAAAVEFNQIALAPAADMKIRKQAADLALDSLGLLKDTTQIQAWSQVYMKSLGAANQNDFSKILQKSSLTKSAELAGQGPDVAYAALIKVNVADLDNADKVKYYKNKMILAEKLKKYSEVIAAADALVQLPGATAEDKEFAWSRKAYLSEIRLDFGTALATTEKLTKTFTPEEKSLKLAIFSELSGESPASSEAYYKKYLQTAANQETKKLVAIELVKKAKNKEQEINKYMPLLSKDSEQLASLMAEAYAQNPSPAILKNISQNAALKQTPAGKLVLRTAFLKELAALTAKIKSHQINTASEKTLVNSIKMRKSLLDQVEALAKTAIDRGDWSSQLLSLNLLSTECDRFYQDVVSAPVPKGLSPEEEAQYLNLLSAQAMPYKNKAVEAKVKTDEFWNTPNWKTAIVNSWAQIEVRNLIRPEIEAISNIASGEVKAELASLKDTAPAQAAVKPSLDEMKRVRQMVYADPMNAAAVQSLLDLEKRSDNKAMASYLENRIEALKKGVVQ